MNREDFAAPREGFVLAHFLTVKDSKRSLAYYGDVLGGKIVMENGPFGYVKLANTWVIVNEGGGPTEDKPDVTLVPPSDPEHASSFMNIRVADIEAKYKEWKSKGAEFLTPPMDRGMETRCYMRDPDEYLIEVGEATGMLNLFEGDSGN